MLPMRRIVPRVMLPVCCNIIKRTRSITEPCAILVVRPRVVSRSATSASLMLSQSAVVLKSAPDRSYLGRLTYVSGLCMQPSANGRSVNE